MRNNPTLNDKPPNDSPPKDEINPEFRLPFVFLRGLSGYTTRIRP